MSKQILRETLAVRRNIEVNANSLKDQVVAIQRVTKVVKGGKNLSFSALVVVGDQNGHAGFGMGKAREVPMAIRKAIEQAKKNLIHLNLKGTTIPHQVLGPLRFRAGAAEARAGRNRNHCRRPGARRDGGCGNLQRADEVHRHVEPAQRHQGDV